MNHPVETVPCPECGHRLSSVADSRKSEVHEGRKRRRVCASCQTRFTTIEILQDEYDRLIEQDAKKGRLLQDLKDVVL